MGYSRIQDALKNLIIAWLAVRSRWCRPDTFARLPPAHNLAKLHLPIAHRHPLSGAALAGKPGWQHVSDQVGDGF